jgi:carbon monoxide dehydrogenase subunit G
MASTSIEVPAPPATVWNVLADPTTYGDWVVGTKSIGRTDPEWPAAGSVLEYEVGVGPISVGDRTVVVECDPLRLLLLRAEFSRLGAVMIRLRLEPYAAGTRVLMDEKPVEGIVDAVHNPLSDAVLKRRNDLALDRLKQLALAGG